MRLYFTSKPNIDPAMIIQLIQRRPTEFNLQGSQRLHFHAKLDNSEQRITKVAEVLQLLAIANN